MAATLATSVIHSLLDYCNSVHYGTLTANLHNYNVSRIILPHYDRFTTHSGLISSPLALSFQTNLFRDSFNHTTTYISRSSLSISVPSNILLFWSLTSLNPIH